MTLTLHTENKMGESMNDLYLFGEDCEAILEILEGDEDMEKQFESSGSDVSTNAENLYFFFGLSMVELLCGILCIATVLFI